VRTPFSLPRVLLGAAVLGRVAGEMIISDPFVVRMLHHPGHLASYLLQALLALGVVVAEKAWKRYRPSHKVMAVGQPIESPFLMDGWDLK